MKNTKYTRYTGCTECTKCTESTKHTKSTECTGYNKTTLKNNIKHSKLVDFDILTC